MRRTGSYLALGLTLWLLLVGAALAQPKLAGAMQRQGDGQQVLVLLRLPAEHSHAEGGFGGGYGTGAARAARRRIAERLAHIHGLTLTEGWPMPLVDVDCFVMTVPAGQSSAQAALSLSREPEVSWSEPMQTYHAQGAHTQGAAPPPKDPLWLLQPAAEAWRLADLHQIATGRGVKVAVIDSLVDSAHPDLIGQIQSSQDFVADHPGGPEQHGTGVAGIIAAVADNGVGIAGIAPGARLMALRACWQDAAGTGTVCDTLSLAKALHFAIEHDAQVINLSLSGPPDPLLGRLLDVAQARGVVVVGAVDPNLAHGGFPASHPGVLAVTDDPARQKEGGVYLAPGRDVPTTKPGARWALANGSSYAAAHVSGLVALMQERKPRGRAPRALVTLRGGGVDACATLLQAANLCHDCACAQTGRHTTMARQ